MDFVGGSKASFHSQILKEYLTARGRMQAHGESRLCAKPGGSHRTRSVDIKINKNCFYVHHKIAVSHEPRLF